MRIARVERFAAAALSGICSDYTRYTGKVDIAADAKRAMLYALAMEREMDRIEEREQRQAPDPLRRADQEAENGSDGIQ